MGRKCNGLNPNGTICGKSSSFNFPSEKTAIKCKEHAETGMISLQKMCEMCNLKQPSYGLPGTKATLCKPCAVSNPMMVDLHHKMCNQKNEDGTPCKTRATYNYPDKKEKGVMCFKHSKAFDGIINYEDYKAKCTICKTKQATCGTPGEKLKYCVACKNTLDNKDDFDYLAGQLCQYIDTDGSKCKKQASFGLENAKATHCSTHCDRTTMIDVKHSICAFLDPKTKKQCKIQPYFNYETEAHGKYCEEHALKDMINVRKNLCITCTKITARYNMPGTKGGRYCKGCAPIGSVDVTETRLCITNLCTTRSQEKYKNYCFFCFVNQFPDEPIVRNYRTKEKSIVDFVNESFPDITITNNKTIPGACSLKRPDLYIDMGSHVIIIEVDEDQHKYSNYDSSCENKRIMAISQDLGHRPIVFIRFNPDSYSIGDKKVASPWSKHKSTGVLYIRGKTEWDTRLQELKKTVENWIKTEATKTVTIVQLFFDA